MEKRTASLGEMLDYIDDILIPFDITVTKKMTYQDILHLYLDLKDVETIFESITELAYIVDEVKNLKN